MTDKLKRQVSLLMVDNPLSPGEKLFRVQSFGTADLNRIASEACRKLPGMNVETVRMVLEAERRVIQELLLSGVRVNSGLYVAELQCKGPCLGDRWDAKRNSIRANFRPGKTLREALSDVDARILGEAGPAIRMNGDAFVAASGHNLTLTGKNIKVAGDDPSVGVTLTSSTGDEVRIGEGRIAWNAPSKLILQIPSGLPAGDYTLRVTTQFTSGGLLKSPRSVEVKVEKSSLI